MQFWLAKTMFKYNSVGAAKQLLDNYYVDYFLPETSDEMQEKLPQKIAIFTHIYLLQCKIDQNKDELEQMLSKNDDENVGKKRKEEEAATSKGKKKGDKKAQTIYAQISGQLSDLFKKAWQNADELSLLCHLLELKNEIFKKLRLKIFGHCAKKPKCANALEAQQTISENREQIAEWLLSDLLHYFPERQRLIGYFK
ncbi:hypothetical protein niasHT_034446 [Heterodera trifolii]|uniref:Uncharacterized protein n=1 Tax=Heterodera trifolii TaxID=157864 RepID=A0ABD2HRI0_9BILA